MKHDPSIEVQLEPWRQKWLPIVPAVSENFFQTHSSVSKIKSINLIVINTSGRINILNTRVTGHFV